MRRIAIALALLAAALSGGVGRSQAVFVATSTNNANTFSTAADFNTVAVSLTDPGTPLRGTVALASTASSDHPLVSVRFQSAPAGTSTWTDRCTDTVAPYTCDWDTAAVADGFYDLRATATDAAGNSTSSTIGSRRVDNTAPATAAMTDPGASLSGSVTLDGTATDNAGGSGIASLRFQYAPTGTTSWTDACSDTSSPYSSCAWDTAAAADGVYDVRALATDIAGNTLASATIAGRRVDNLVPAVALTDPGTPLGGTRTLTTTASDGGGIANVVFARKPSSGSTWTTICTDTTASYTCSWNTSTLTDGSYDLRASATDNFGRTSTSTVTGRVVDNTGPRASAVTSTSGGTSGMLSAGDAIALTFTEAIAPESLASGWTGVSGRSASIFFDRVGFTTTVAVTDTASGSAVPLGALAYTGRFTGGAGATFDGTMTLSGSVVTVTLSGAPTQGSTRPDTVPAPIAWTNSTAVTDAAGNPGVATPVAGTGQL